MSEDLVKTGITGLDQVLGGGFRQRQSILVTGEPGTGLKKIGELTSAGIDFAETAISTIVENLMVVRKVELRGHMRRVLAVMTMRDTAFETEVHEFEVSDSGNRVGRIVDDAEGVLSPRDPRLITREATDDDR